MYLEEQSEEVNPEELYQTSCEEIDHIFGMPIKKDSKLISQEEPSRKEPVLQKKQALPVLARKTTRTRQEVDLLIAYYLCQLKAVRYGITLPNELKEPEEIKEAIHTYQLQRFQKRMGHKSR